MEHFSCIYCDRIFDSYDSLRRHIIQKHNIRSVDVYIKYKCNGNRPTCECGCGRETKFLGSNKGFRRFINGHNSMTSDNNYHKNPETKLKSAKTQSENWKKGKYKGWWEEDTQEVREKIEGIKEKLRNDKKRAKKISKSLSGRPKTQEHKNKLSKTVKNKYKNNPELRKELSKKRLKWMRENSQVKTSFLEVWFKEFFYMLGLKEDVDFEHNYLVENIKTFFDFRLIKQNILIEVDGDFYHCNPNTEYSKPKYDIQHKNIGNDKRKSSWAKNHNIKLVRFWEKDINERPEWVIEEIRKLL